LQKEHAYKVTEGISI